MGSILHDRRRRTIAWTTSLLLPAALLGLAARGDRPAEIERLVTELGDPDYAVRETASDRLASLGHDAADALLTAAEVSDDLEVALRARWLANPGSPLRGSDPAEATRLLEDLAKAVGSERNRIMEQLLRLPDDAGIEPLARLVRLEPTAAGSRVAASLLADEWRPDNPYWPEMASRILAGLGASERPASRFLRGFVAHTAATSDAAAAAGLEACREALAVLDRRLDEPPRDDGEPDAADVTESRRIFRRLLVELLARAGRRDDALAAARRLLPNRRQDAAIDADQRAALEIHWLAEHGLPAAVELVADRLAAEDVGPLLLYAAAFAHRAGEPADPTAAALLATRARRRLAGIDGGDRERAQLIAAVTLAEWAAFDWVDEVYDDLLGDPGTSAERRVQAVILHSELLHEQGRDAEAAAALATIMDPATGQAERAALLFNRNAESLRSRMLYFAACAEPDPAASRRLLEAALRSYARDVDALIAIYRLADNTPEQQAEAVARIGRALSQIEEDIEAVPGDPNGKNEYAWLVANTVGDLEKATRYSRASLELSPDSGSFLDTLAHCHAAAGNLDRALRTQWLALKTDPHSPMIRRNYERFLALAAGDPPE